MYLVFKSKGKNKNVWLTTKKNKNGGYMSFFFYKLSLIFFVKKISLILFDKTLQYLKLFDKTLLYLKYDTYYYYKIF